MGVETAIIGAVSLGVTLYGKAKERQNARDNAEAQKKANELNYKEGMQTIDNAQTDLKTNYDNTTSNLSREMDQAADKINREVSQTRESADINRQAATDAYGLVADQKQQAFADAKNQIVDLSRSNVASESAAKNAAAKSGVRNSGTILETQSQLADYNDETEDRAQIKVDNEISNFEKQTDNYFSDADEQKRQANQAADNALLDLEDMRDDYNDQLGQLQETYNQKVGQLDNSRSILTEKYENQAWIDNVNLKYTQSGQWADFVTAGLGAANTSLAMYNNLSDIDTSSWFGNGSEQIFTDGMWSGQV